MSANSPWSIFLIFLRLGCTSFGGPIAHLGYFRQEFVQRRRWLDETAYADLVALCQFLPGPASSQVGMALGLGRGGYAGAAAAWLGFTLPSALLLTLLALGLASDAVALPGGALQGLKIVAVAVVAQALWGMATQLCRGRVQIALMTLSATVLLLWPGTPSQLLVMLVAAGVGLALLRHDASVHVAAQAHGETAHQPSATPAAMQFPKGGPAWLLCFALLLLALPLALAWWPQSWLALVDAFYRAGALVFGGGHVVLPLLQSAVVAPGWLDASTFIAGYGAAQAVPGPLFSFAAFLGAAMAGWGGALLCLLAIFAPSFLLVAGVLPYWQRLRVLAPMRAVLAGVNAAVVGLLLAALYDPIWTSAIRQPHHMALALVAFIALQHARLPPWLVVLGCALVGVGVEGGLRAEG